MFYFLTFFFPFKRFETVCLLWPPLLQARHDMVCLTSGISQSSACKYWQYHTFVSTCPRSMICCCIFLTSWQLTAVQWSTGSQCQGYIIIWAQWCQPWLMLTWIHPCRALQHTESAVQCCHATQAPSPRTSHKMLIKLQTTCYKYPASCSSFWQKFKRSPWLVKKLIERQ